MDWKDIPRYERLRSLLLPTTKNISPLRSLFGLWIFVSCFLLLIFLHPLRTVKIKPQYTRTIIDDARNSTLGFQKIFVINLESRTDRHNRILLGSKMTGLNIEFFNAVTNVSDRAIPPGGRLDYPIGVKGCWRSHMDVLAKIVREDIATALILEDDISWDLNIRTVFPNLARAVHVLTHPLANGSYLDPTFPMPIKKDRSQPKELPLNSNVSMSSFSPFGDVWDMLWLGHCSGRLTDDSNVAFARGRVSWEDSSVPTHLWENYNMGHLVAEQYPNHTRIIQHAYGNVCTFGYAVTQAMARRLLWHASVRQMNAPVDLEYAQICEGMWTDDTPQCLTALPPYFASHRPKGNQVGFSDIDLYNGEQDYDFTPNLRYSVMQNIDNWVEGKPLVESAPDDKRPPWI